MELIPVMEPVLAKNVMKGPEFVHQIKWDGIRGVTYIQNGSYRLFTKSGRERTDFYPELQDTLRLLQGQQAVLDGELVVFDANNRPSFQKVLTRERVRNNETLPLYLRKYPVHYIIFDILFLNGTDLRALPFEQRTEILQAHLPSNERIALTDIFTEGAQLFTLMKQQGYEGIVSKKRQSSYLPGKKHDLWYKTKVQKKILAVIGGLSWKANLPNSLFLGIYQDGQLRYIGNASVGLSQQEFRLLKEHTAALRVAESPFANLTKAKGSTWLQPLLTCWVSFLEWTTGQSLRHPQILGFSNEDPSKANGKEWDV